MPAPLFGVVVVHTLDLKRTVVTTLTFGAFTSNPVAGIVTTGLVPFAIGSVVNFVANNWNNGLWWNLTGGSATITFADPAGNLYGPFAATISGGAPQFAWKIVGPVGTWTLSWTLTDAQGVTEVCDPIAFAVASSPR